MGLGSDDGATERRGGFTVAGVAERGAEIDIDRLWAAFDRYADALEGVAVGTDRYGVVYDLDTDAPGYTYLAGRRVDSIEGLDPELAVVEIPDAVYDAFTPTAGSVNDVVDATESAAFETGERTDGPMFERYGPGEDPTDPTVALELYVPVEG
jgi:predicted transcriptional regulator YdeE